MASRPSASVRRSESLYSDCCLISCHPLDRDSGLSSKPWHTFPVGKIWELVYRCLANGSSYMGWGPVRFSSLSYKTSPRGSNELLFLLSWEPVLLACLLLAPPLYRDTMGWALGSSTTVLPCKYGRLHSVSLTKSILLEGREVQSDFQELFLSVQ
jgi:hypothetical protein